MIFISSGTYKERKTPLACMNMLKALKGLKSGLRPQSGVCVECRHTSRCVLVVSSTVFLFGETAINQHYSTGGRNDRFFTVAKIEVYLGRQAACLHWGTDTEPQSKMEKPKSS